MASSYSTNEFRSGLKILVDGDLYSIVENEFVKPGKGQAFNRVKIRNLKTGRVIEKTYKSGDSVEAADATEVEMEFLYTDGGFWHFMQSETFEQFAADADVVGTARQWLKQQDKCQVTLWNNTPISIVPANHVVLTVMETEPGIRGDTAQGATKPATVETGATVRVPLFIDIGDSLRIDTRTGEYLSRVKSESP